jgi:DNA-binding NarL/FixJ family response regulator
MTVSMVDDYPVTRDGLRSALSTSDGDEIVGEPASGEEAPGLVKELTPGGVVIQRQHATEPTDPKEPT